MINPVPIEIKSINCPDARVLPNFYDNVVKQFTGVTGKLQYLGDSMGMRIGAKGSTPFDVRVDPVQDGSGDPSPTNVRAITGWTGASIYVSGKNMLQRATPATATTDEGTTFVKNDDGSVTVTTSPNAATFINYVYASGVQRLPSGVPLKVYGGTTGLGVRICYATQNGTTVTLTTTYTNNGASFTIPTTAVTSWVRIVATPDFSGTPTTIYPMVTNGDNTDNTWEPPHASKYNIDWTDDAGEVYGGYFSVGTNKLYITHKMVDLGSLTWNYTSAYGGFYAAKSDAIAASSNGDITAICSCYRRGNYSSDWTDYSFVVSDSTITTSKRVYIKDSRYTNANDFKTAVTGQKLVYKLGTQQTISLSDVPDIYARIGETNVWADCGSIEGLYYIGGYDPRQWRY